MFVTPGAICNTFGSSDTAIDDDRLVMLQPLEFRSHWTLLTHEDGGSAHHERQKRFTKSSEHEAVLERFDDMFHLRCDTMAEEINKLICSTAKPFEIKHIRLM